MTEKEVIERDISLAFDFLRYAVDHPEILDEVPDNAELEFIATDMVIQESNIERHNEDNDYPKAILVAKKVFTPLKPIGGSRAAGG